MVIAAVLTIMILGGYGAVTAWEQLADDGTPTEPTGRGFVASTTRAIQDGHAAILLGVNLRLLADVYHFRNDMDALIDGVRTERDNLERVANRSPAARALIARSAVDATTRLEFAMSQWRDAIFLTQLGRVDDAQAGIEAAVAQLEADRNRWTTGRG